MRPSLVDRDKYFEHALSFSEREEGLSLQYARWLPDVIIDVHAHCNRKEHVFDIPEKAYRHMLSTFPYFSLEESAEVNV